MLLKFLTAELEKRMLDITFSTPDWKSHKLINTIRRIYCSGKLLTPEQFVEFNISLFNLYKKYSSSKPEEAAFNRQEVESYHDTLEKLRLTDVPPVEEISILKTAIHLTHKFIIFCIYTGMALPGIILHLPVYILARLTQAKTSRFESRTMNKVMISLLSMPLLYAIVMIASYKLFGSAGFLTSCFVLPLISYFHLRCLEKGVVLWRSVSRLFHLLLLITISRPIVEDMAKRRQQIFNNIEKLFAAHTAETERIIKLRAAMRNTTSNPLLHESQSDLFI